MQRDRNEMSSNEVYKKKFEEILEAEKRTIELYKYYVDRIEDLSLLEKFKEIYTDELSHVAIAEKIVRMVSE